MNLYQMPFFAGANFRQRIIPNKVRYVKRFLPGKGQLSVLKNEELKPEDVLGKYISTPGFSMVNLSKRMQISPQEAGKYLQKPIGSTIFKGELLAFKKGLFKKTIVLAPTDGVLDEYDPKTGELRLKFFTKEAKLVSGVYGIVENVDKQRNEVLIKTVVTEIFGVMGSGNERDGLLSILSEPGTLVQPSQVTTEMSKRIIVAGSLVYGDTLRKAAGFGVNGIIAGGINATDFRALTGTVDLRKRVGNDVGISLLVSEGFGLIPIGEDIFSELKEYDGEYIFMNGNTASIYLPSKSADSILAAKRISLPSNRTVEIAPELELKEISPGHKVRIIWPPFMGIQGKVLAVDKTSTLLESGISTIMITIETPNRKIKVPFANLEIIG